MFCYNEIRIRTDKVGVRLGVLEIIQATTLTYEQKVVALAREAEKSLDVLRIRDEAKALRDKGIICELNEGNAPYRPRYILPDYDKFMKNGSAFLRLDPPKDIWEAVNHLLILYRHVPSITTQPVYVGSLDTLLEPFVTDLDEARRAVRFLLIHLDRTVTDSFCHANIGPKETRIGHIILEVERELQNAVPNITLKYAEAETPDSFAIKAAETALTAAKPSFANHNMFVGDLGIDYGIASCYNGLKIGGGSYTLVRMVLSRLADEAKDECDFLEHVLPGAVQTMAELMDERVRFLVEESRFFDTNFLVREGLIKRDRFTAMFGLVGLAECVNTLLGAVAQEDRFGYSERADQLGLAIIEKMQSELAKRSNPYCQATNGKYLLHAQVGIETDYGISPGCRIPIGEEPDLPAHIRQTSLFHKSFPSGIGDIFPFDETVKRNPAYVLDIIKGAFKSGMRYLSIYGDDCDVIRITGYLVKKSDMEKLDRGEAVLNDAVALGLGAAKNSKILERRVRHA